MDKNEVLLTVLVTTYNRKPFLEKIIDIFSEYFNRGLKFKMLISDDCSSDGTQEMCEKTSLEKNWLEYYRLDKNSGMDANFRNAYIHCTTKYCWLLGDHRYIEYEELKEILDTLSENKYNALILKCREEAPLFDILYTDVNKLFKEIGFNITNNASCVIPTSFYKEYMYQRYKGTTFLHMGIFLENICAKDSFDIKYLSNVMVKNIDVKGFDSIGWNNHPFLNFGKYWVNFILSLPSKIDATNKLFVLKEHNKITRLFTLKNLVRGIIVYGNIYVNSYKEARQYMKYASYRPVWQYDFIFMCFPRFLRNFLAKLRIKL